MRIIAFAGVYLGSAVVALGTIALALVHLEAVAPLVVGCIVGIVMVRRATTASRGRRKVADTEVPATPTAEPVRWTSGGTLT